LNGEPNAETRDRLKNRSETDSIAFLPSNIGGGIADALLVFHPRYRDQGQFLASSRPGLLDGCVITLTVAGGRESERVRRDGAVQVWKPMSIGKPWPGLSVIPRWMAYPHFSLFSGAPSYTPALTVIALLSNLICPYWPAGANHKYRAGNGDVLTVARYRDT